MIYTVPWWPALGVAQVEISGRAWGHMMAVACAALELGPCAAGELEMRVWELLASEPTVDSEAHEAVTRIACRRALEVGLIERGLGDQVRASPSVLAIAGMKEYS